MLYEMTVEARNREEAECYMEREHPELIVRDLYPDGFQHGENMDKLHIIPGTWVAVVEKKGARP